MRLADLPIGKCSEYSNLADADALDKLLGTIDAAALEMKESTACLCAL